MKDPFSKKNIERALRESSEAQWKEIRNSKHYWILWLWLKKDRIKEFFGIKTK